MGYPLILPELAWGSQPGNLRGLDPAGSLALWTPAAVGPAIWLDGAEGGSVLTASGKVYQWSDKSGNGRHFTQSTEARRPVPVTGGLGGMSTIGIYNTAQPIWLENSNFAYAGTTMAWFSVNTNNTGANAYSLYGRLWSHASATEQDYNNLNGILVTYGVTTGVAIYRNSIAVCTTPAVNNRWCLISAERNGASARISMDAGAFATGATSSNAQNIARSRIGNDFTVIDSGLYGQIAEQLLFTKILPQPDIERVEGYLAHKWGLASLLPLSHPYKYLPPFANPQTGMPVFPRTFSPAWAVNVNRLIQ